MMKVDLQRLKSAMADAGLDQSALAREVGCTPGAINQIVQGNVLRSRWLPDIAWKLGVSFDWLIGEDEAKRRLGAAPAKLVRDEYDLIDNYRPLRSKDQRALARISMALRRLDEEEQGVTGLPSEAALADMFEALLQVYGDLPRDELARALAKRLPSGLSRLREAPLIESSAVDPAPTEADVPLPAERRVRRQAQRK